MNPKYEQACELFGDDIGELVDNLLCLDCEGLHQKIFLIPSLKLKINSVDEWILVNIGLPEWVAPHLNITLRFDPIASVLIIGEQAEDDDIVILDNGKVFLKSGNNIDLLNSSLINFLKGLILYQTIINQSLLVFGTTARADNKIPKFVRDYFIKMLQSTDSIEPKTWIKFAQLEIHFTQEK